MSNTSRLCLSVCQSCAVCFTCSGYAEGRQRESQPKQSFYSCHVSTSVSFLCPDLSWSVSWREQKELKRIGAASVQPAHTRVMGWGMLILPTCLPQHWGMGRRCSETICSIRTVFLLIHPLYDVYRNWTAIVQCANFCKRMLIFTFNLSYHEVLLCGKEFACTPRSVCSMVFLWVHAVWCPVALTTNRLCVSGSVLLTSRLPGNLFLSSFTQQQCIQIPHSTK